MKDKLKTHEVARLAGLHVNTVRTLERTGVIQCDRSTAGFRVFDRSVLKQIANHYQKRNRRIRP